MIHKPIDTIVEADVQQAIADQLREGKQLEYKEMLPGNGDKDKVEFLADISAMANAAGGYIVYGVAEKRDPDGKTSGIPREPLVGLTNVNPDAEIRRLEDLLRSCLQPRLQGVRFQDVPLENGNLVLVVQVPRSWNGPHVVTIGNHWRFYSRNSAGKQQMDVGELRTAITLAETVNQRLHQFRLDRLAKIVAGETPAGIEPGAKAVLHLLPLGMLNPGSQIDLARLKRDHEMQVLPIYYGNTWGTRLNVDGLVAYANQHQLTSGYIQVFRSGAIEAVDVTILREYQFHSPDTPLIPSLSLEMKLIEATKGYLTLLQTLGVTAPLVLTLSLLGVKGYTMEVRREHGMLPALAQIPVDRDDLILPETLVEDLTTDAAQLLKPSFDMIWNACGRIGSVNYNDHGNWIGP